MMRALIFLTLLSVAAPAVGGAAPKPAGTANTEAVETLVVRPKSAYVQRFTERLQQRQDRRRAQLRDMKAGVLTATAAREQSRLLLRSLRMPVGDRTPVASK